MNSVDLKEFTKEYVTAMDNSVSKLAKEIAALRSEMVAKISENAKLTAALIERDRAEMVTKILEAMNANIHMGKQIATMQKRIDDNDA